MEEHRLRVVLFDLGNTLFCFDGDWEQVLEDCDRAIARFLLSTGLAINEEEFLRHFTKRLNLYFQDRETDFIEHTTGKVLQDTLAEMGFTTLPLPVQRAALSAYYAISEAHWILEDDAVAMLQELRQGGYHLALVSNASDAQDVFTILKRAQLTEYFEKIIISAEVGIRKPHPRIFQLALDAFNVFPRQAVMVGDTLGADILGANNLGITSVWITRRDSQADAATFGTFIQPTFKIANLAELPSVLQKL